MKVLSNKTEAKGSKAKWNRLGMPQFSGGDKPFGKREGKNDACVTSTHYGVKDSRQEWTGGAGKRYNILKLELLHLKWDKIEQFFN